MNNKYILCALMSAISITGSVYPMIVTRALSRLARNVGNDVQSGMQSLKRDYQNGLFKESCNFVKKDISSLGHTIGANVRHEGNRFISKASDIKSGIELQALKINERIKDASYWLKFKLKMVPQTFATSGRNGTTHYLYKNKRGLFFFSNTLRENGQAVPMPKLPTQYQVVYGRNKQPLIKKNPEMPTQQGIMSTISDTCDNAVNKVDPYLKKLLKGMHPERLARGF